MKKLSICAAATFYLAACGTGGGNGEQGAGNEPGDALSVPVENLEHTEGFITDIDGGRVLVNDTYYTIDEESHFVSIGDGKERELEMGDLEKGMRADVYHSGMTAKSFPAQGHASVFVVPDDELPVRQTKAFQAFLEKEGDEFIILGQPELGEDKILFDYTIVSASETYAVELDVENHDYTKEPKNK